MGIFDELDRQYTSINDEYASKEFIAHKRKWTKKAKAYARNRQLNDQAYFLFMFSRLEDHINQEALKRILKKQASKTSWKEKAPWLDLPTKIADMRNLPFKKRLSLLCEKGQKDFNLMVDFYDERNSLAHGGGFVKPIILPIVITEFIRLQKSLKA